jgi:biopolymer transport protein ExbD
MNLRSSARKESPDVNLTPLIDVVFLLLIFFMVSTTFKRDTEIKVDLPEANAEVVQHEEKPLEIIVDEKGRYFIGQQELVNQRLRTMKSVLLKEIGKDKKRTLVIRADQKSPHGAVVLIMDAARQVGIVNLSIATTRSADDS